MGPSLNHPVWLLPGFMGTHAHFGRVPELLQKNHNSCTVIDWAHEFQDHQDIKEMARAISEKAVAQKIKPWLVGYSMGGRLTLECLVSYPDIFSGFIALSAHPGFQNLAERRKRLQEDLEWSHLLNHDLMTFWDKWNKRAALATSAPLALPQWETSERRLWADILVKMSTGSQRYFPAELDVTIPLMLMVGQKDADYVKHLSQFPASIKKIVIPNSGHRMPVDVPEQVASAIIGFMEVSL